MINTIKPIKAICIYDKAIVDCPNDKIIEYVHTRDLALIEPYIDNSAKPVYFHVKRLSRSIMYREIMPMADEHQRAVACFQYCVTQVDNMPNDTGGTLTWMPSGTKQTADGDISFISQKEIDERFDVCDVQEIGTMGWYISFLRRGNGDCLAAPPTSLDLWARRASRSVLLSRSNALLNSLKQDLEGQEQLQQTTEQMQEIGGDSSGQHTAASAEASL